MEKIYLMKKDKVMLGPYTLEKLKEKQLKTSDLVWYEGLADWTPVGNLADFTTKSISPIAEKPQPKFSLSSFLKNLFADRK